MTVTQLEQIILTAYALFLLLLLYLAINIQYYASHQKDDYPMGTISYNLRDIPRVDYTELSAEEEEEEEKEEEKKEDGLRNRRDRNPVSRLLEEALT